MAADLRKVWFTAVHSANVTQISRLLYSTPTPEAGEKRLRWTLDPQQDSWATSWPGTTSCPEKSSDRNPFLGIGNWQNMDALSLSILLYFCDPVRSTRRKEVMDTIVAATKDAAVTGDVMAHVWGNDNTALHLAGFFEERNLFELLVSRGADPRRKNVHGITAQQLLDEPTHVLVKLKECGHVQMEDSVVCEEVDKMEEEPPVKALEDPSESTPRALFSEVAVDASMDVDMMDEDMDEDAIEKQLLERAAVSAVPATPKPVVQAPVTVAPLKLKRRDTLVGLSSTSALTSRLPSAMQPKSAETSTPTPLSSIHTSDLLQMVNPVTATTLLPSTADQKMQFKQARKTSIGYSCTPTTSVLNDIPVMSQMKTESVSGSKIVTMPQGSPSKVVKKRQITPRSRGMTPTLDKSALIDKVLEPHVDYLSSEMETEPYTLTPPSAMEMSQEVMMAESGPVPVEKDHDILDSSPQITVKSDLILIHQEDEREKRPPSPKKNVSFGNSWKGTLETQRSFVKNASIGNWTRDSYTAEECSPSRLYLKFVGLHGLVMNMAKIPESASLYFLVRCGPHQQHFSKPFTCCPENMYTSIPLHDEFLLMPSDNSVITVELRLRAEFKKSTRFNPRRMLQSSTGSIRKFLPGSRAGSRAGTADPSIFSAFQEETICTLAIPLSQIKDACSDTVLDHPWSLKVDGNLAMNQSAARSHSRSSSRIMEAGQMLFSKFGSHGNGGSERPPSRLFSGTPADLASSVEISEPGTLQMQLFYIQDCHAKEHGSVAVPARMDQVQGWLLRKQWLHTCWFAGSLSQQGGDVKAWRRRYFKIIGTKMEAYHEFTKEYRTTIDLSQATELKSLAVRLDGDSYPMKWSFRLLFKHGEHIDFYADNEHMFDQWMGILEKVIRERPEEVMLLGQDSSEPASKEATLSGPAQRRPGVSEIDWQHRAADREVVASTKEDKWMSSRMDMVEEEAVMYLDPKQTTQKVPASRLESSLEHAKPSRRLSLSNSFLFRKKNAHGMPHEDSHQNNNLGSIDEELGAPNKRPLHGDHMEEDFTASIGTYRSRNKATPVGVFGTHKPNRVSRREPTHL